jgi:hypothetical protein
MSLATTGFPIIHGVPGAGRPGTNRKNAKRLQTMIMSCEKLLRQFGRAKLERLYLFDGDFTVPSLLSLCFFGATRRIRTNDLLTTNYPEEPTLSFQQNQQPRKNGPFKEPIVLSV